MISFIFDVWLVFVFWLCIENRKSFRNWEEFSQLFIQQLPCCDIVCGKMESQANQNNKRCWCVHSIQNTNANRLKDDTITKFTHKYTCCSVLVFGSVDITCRVFYYGNLTKFIFTISLVINKYERDRCYFCFVLLLSSFNQIKHDLQPMLLNLLDPNTIYIYWNCKQLQFQIIKTNKSYNQSSVRSLAHAHSHTIFFII